MSWPPADPGDDSLLSEIHNMYITGVYNNQREREREKEREREIYLKSLNFVLIDVYNFRSINVLDLQA